MSAKHERKAGNRRNKRERKLADETPVRRIREEDRLVRVRYTKKSLPGFLAKNAGAILQWLKEYETLYALADDYGFQRIDRMPPERQAVLQENYVKISDFITVAQQIIAGEAVAEDEPERPDEAGEPEKTETGL